MRRLAVALGANILALALFAPVALAADEINGGEGLYGETTDKVVTNFGFAVIAFFPLLILILSLIQWGLDRRKERRKAAAKARRGRAQWTGGW
jgi:hypothetical protein